jgi:dTDP-glucose 4,6-dehydratase
MKILVTGGCGFIGSFVCEAICRRYPDATVVILDALYPCASEKNVESLLKSPLVHLHRGTLQNRDLVALLFEQYRFEWVFHLAAQSHVDTSFSTPLQFTQDNVVGTHTLLEGAREVGCVTRFLYVSTDEVYGSTSDEAPNTVYSLLEPSNPYAATKAAAEMLVKSYIHSFKLPAHIVRMNNVYGPRQYPEKMIPKFIRALRTGEPIQIQGSGLQRRSLLYVEDAAEALLRIFETATPNQIVNIPSVDEFTVLEIATRVSQAMGKELAIVYVQDRPYNDKRYWIHGDGHQTTSFEEGLRKTIVWYTEHAIETYWSR